MRKLYILFLTISLSGSTLHAQDRGYDFSWRKDGLMLGGGTAMYILGEISKRRVNTLTEEDILLLDAENINAFDRGAVDNNRTSDGDLSNYLLVASALTPATIFISESTRKDVLPFLFIYLETATAVNGVTNITKGLTSRTRPYVYNPLSDADKTSIKARHSFFSGHVSNAAAFSFLTATLVQEYADKKAWKIVAWSGAVVLPGLVGYLRYSAGSHFPTDIITGYIVGGGIGLMVPYLHRKKLPADISGLDVEFLGNGIMITYNF